MYRGKQNQITTAVLDFELFPNEPAIKPVSEPESPLTLALFRSRWLISYATPSHARGTTFVLGASRGK